MSADDKITNEAAKVLHRADCGCGDPEGDKWFESYLMIAREMLTVVEPLIREQIAQEFEAYEESESPDLDELLGIDPNDPIVRNIRQAKRDDLRFTKTALARIARGDHR